MRRTKNAQRDAEIVALYTGDSWVSPRVAVERFGFSRRRVYQILKAAGAVRTPRPPAVKPAPRVTYRGPCVDCGEVNQPRGYIHQRCASPCYMRWLYRTSKKRREDVRRYNAAWAEKHPEQAREIRLRAQHAYRERQKAKRQQEQQP